MERNKEELNRAINILKILNKAIESGPWTKSIYLRGTGKKLREIRDRFKSQCDLTEDLEATLETAMEPRGNAKTKLKDLTKVYISLYTTPGTEIKNWERLLNTIGNSIITRPVLKNERDVRELIRSKVNKKNEAYVVAYVNPTDMIEMHSAHAPRDALGHELIMLKSGSIQLENIKSFYHISGWYLFEEGKLIRQGDVEFSDFV